MKNELENNKYVSIFTKKYWKDAARQFCDVRMITVAALIVALRVTVKLFKLSIAQGLSISLDAYVNSVGSVIYGPLVGLMVGAVSDLLGLIVTGQIGEYFPPFTLVEMISSFIFGLFFWKRKIGISRSLAAKFSVNLVCNIIMTSIFMKWMKYILAGPAAAESYKMINGVRIAKNLILFPLEATIIVVVLAAVLPILARVKLIDKNYCFIDVVSKRRLMTEVIFFTALSIAIVLLYIALSDNLTFDIKLQFENIFK